MDFFLDPILSYHNKRQKLPKLFFKLMAVKLHPHKKLNQPFIKPLHQYLSLWEWGNGFRQLACLPSDSVPPMFLSSEVQIFIKLLLNSEVVSVLTFSTFGLWTTQVKVPTRGFFLDPRLSYYNKRQKLSKMIL